MPIEDVFSITGRGTVVTGRIETGVIPWVIPSRSSVWREDADFDLHRRRVFPWRCSMRARLATT